MSDINIQNVLSTARAQNTQQTGQMTSEQAADFSQALAREMSLMQSAQAGTSAAGEASALSQYTPLMLNATAGQGLESQILMMLMMLTTGQADVSSMMSLLSQAVTSMQDEAEKEKLRRSIMDSSYENELLDLVNEGVFAGASSAYPYEAWKSCQPTQINDQQSRSAEEYADVIAQFGVETNPRYQNNKRGDGDTYCNIFVWDVTSAMSAEIPHYIDAATGAPRYYPNTKGATELSANGIYNWLQNNGARYGWHEVSAEQAQAAANAGLPAVTAWYNTQGSGHVQVVRPNEAGYDAARGVAVAQAGTRRLESTYANDIFSQNAMEQLRYYIHE